jgi:hypothetical protein
LFSNICWVTVPNKNSQKFPISISALAAVQTDRGKQNFKLAANFISQDTLSQKIGENDKKLI